MIPLCEAASMAIYTSLQVVSKYQMSLVLYQEPVSFAMIEEGKLLAIVNNKY